MTPSRFIAIIIGAALLLTLPFVGSKLFENLDASEIMVVQSPFSGELTWHTAPGTKWQGMGTVTKYQRRHQFWFSYDSGPESSKDESIKIRFNDGAHAAISGSLSWEMPLDPEHLTKIHMAYGNEKAIEDQLIETNLEKSVYMAGPIMSSAESYAARRNDLLGLIDDQFQRGVYQTRSRDERITDPITNQPKTVKIVDPVVGPDGQILREEESPLIGMGIKAFNLSINEVKYDPSVEAQIQKQQESIMAVQTAIAAAKTAEQEVLTVEANGKASAAKAEWAQRELMATETTKAEQEKMVAVTAAQKELEVAQLKTQAAEQQKLAEILLGEGEATRRKLVMDADGALEKKLTAYMEVNSYYAQAIGAYGGSWVPSIVMGVEGAQNGQAGSNGANELISLLTAKTAKDLKLEMDFSSKAGTLPEIKRPEMPKFQLKKSEGPAWGTSYLLPTAPKTPVPTLKK
jgi:regulator of protease activity HflC (stomatin/prohibitin superfamily)